MIDYEYISGLYTLVQLLLWFPMLVILAVMSVPIMLHTFVFHNAMPKYYNERNTRYGDRIDATVTTQHDDPVIDDPRNLRIRTRSFSE